MSGMDWVERMEDIRSMCGKIADGMQECRRMGRMPAIDEARTLDRLSQDLLGSVRQLPADVFSRIGDSCCRARMKETIGAAMELLEPLVGEPGSFPRTGAGLPRAASGRMKAYQVC